MNKDYVHKLAEKDTRIDGRKFDEYRQPISIETDVSSTADGSALVTIGDTQVMAGVKMELGTPYSDAPDQGTLMINVELLPLSHPRFDPGPPSIQAIELARVIDRGIRESHSIDTHKLCVTPGEKVWTVIVDICPINDAGNLFDAGALAAIAAIKNTKLPAIKDGIIDYKNKTDEGLPLAHTPLSCTVLKIGNKLVVDPLSEEEESYESRLTVATTEKDELCALQKGGEEPLTIDEVDTMVKLAIAKTKELRKFL